MWEYVVNLIKAQGGWYKKWLFSNLEIGRPYIIFRILKAIFVNECLKTYYKMKMSNHFDPRI